MDYEKYIKGLQIRIDFLINKIDEVIIGELENVQAELKVLIHLKKTAQDEMHKTD